MSKESPTTPTEPRQFTAPLFPLGHPALFPNMAQPFQIFEPRYRVMTADALCGDQLIAMATLAPGWEPHYNTKTVPILPVVCLGKIIAHERLPDGRFLLMLRGVCRAKVLEEPENKQPYRIGKLLELPSRLPSYSLACRDRCRHSLIKAVEALCPPGPNRPALAPFLNNDMCLGELCDILTFALKMPSHEAYHVLAELNVDCRVEYVMNIVQKRLIQAGFKDVNFKRQDFPPRFSSN